MHSNNREAWMKEALKVGGGALVEALVDMSDGIHRVEEAQKKHAEETAKQFDKIRAELAATNNGFVSGDADGHRRWHELQIRKVEELRRLRIAIQEKTISGLIWACIVGAGALIFDGIKAKLGV